MMELIQNIGDYFGGARTELIIAWIFSATLITAATIYAFILTSEPKYIFHGDPGAIIPKGTKIQDARGMKFQTTKTVKIGRGGKTSVPVSARIIE